MANWRQSEIEKLISLVEQNPCLYNVRCQEYLDRTKKAKVYIKILNEMKKSMGGLNVEKIKSKWKNLRTQYLREHRALRQSIKSGADKCNIYVPKLWCFQQLSFLASHVQLSANVDNIRSIGIKSSNLREIPQIKVDMETEACDASNSSGKTPIKGKKGDVFEEFRRDLDGFQAKITSNLRRRSYKWLGDLVSAQMEDVLPEQQADAAWRIQCLMRKLASDSSREETKQAVQYCYTDFSPQQ